MPGLRSDTPKAHPPATRHVQTKRDPTRDVEWLMTTTVRSALFRGNPRAGGEYPRTPCPRGGLFPKDPRKGQNLCRAAAVTL